MTIRKMFRMSVGVQDGAAPGRYAPRILAAWPTALTRVRMVLPLLLALPALQADAQVPVVPDPDYDACMVRMKSQAALRGVPAASFDRFMAGVAADRSVLDLLNAQPEFTTPIWDYLAGLVDDERVADGRAMLETHRDLLARVEREYGVDPVTVVAVWGVESDFGRVSGKRPLLQSLSTLSCFGRRQEFFRGEFIATLKLLHDGDLNDPAITGSWAGAFGHTQFMPTTYARIAVDFDGDGRRDLVGSIPDALASTANYLKRSGWQTGRPWGHEVKVPANFDTSLAGRTNRRPLSDWVARGVTRVDGVPLSSSDVRSAILLPAGRDGPAFLVFRNYDAIYSYNAAESYALAIATLADRLRGGSGVATPWPTDDSGLSRAQRRELQELLLARGHDIGAVDGMIGTNTRRAIRDEQQRLGLVPADGRAGRRILEALRGAGAPSTRD
jgi:lytic murein transglycosylase